MSNRHNKLIGFLVYEAQRSLFRSLEETLRPYGITPGQWNLLNQLDRSGSLSQKALADATRKEQATITRYLDTLERKGLIVRAKDTNDRRAHVISITEQARTLIEQVEPCTIEVADNLVADIEQDDIDTFLAVLEHLKTNAETYSDTHQAHFEANKAPLPRKECTPTSPSKRN
ncbi:MAG: MarR family transcriptional regulator [Raoultibacter sp.]